MAEEVGAPAAVPGGRRAEGSERNTSEPRWNAADVARAVEREGEQLCLGWGREDIDRAPSGRTDLSRADLSRALGAREADRVARSFPAEATHQLDR
jgi:hypothetical protein